MIRFEALTVFPEMFEPYLSRSIMGRARARGVYSFEAFDLRDWTHDRHRTVDDAPFGGGQGMLMKCGPLIEAIEDISGRGDAIPHVVFFSPCGRPFDQSVAYELSKKDRVLLVCGRYEGIDERALELADQTISMGDYVLTGGELPALSVIDSCVRLLPGALGDEMSAVDESFSDGLLEYAQYTRPAEYRGRCVPKVLLSGNHAAIAAWRRESSLARTARWRPDLLDAADLSEDERAFVSRIIGQRGDSNDEPRD